MNTKVLEIDITDSASVARAVEYLDNVKHKLENMDAYIQQLADIGVSVAEEAFRGALANPDFTEGVEVEAIPTDNGYTITASGSEVAFIEFGTGVFYNGSESYPGQRPAGIVGIGEYGQGKGSRRAWGYYAGGDKSNLVITRGHYRSAGMYSAQKAMVEQAINIIEEIFND